MYNHSFKTHNTIQGRRSLAVVAVIKTNDHADPT